MFFLTSGLIACPKLVWAKKKYLTNISDKSKQSNLKVRNHRFHLCSPIRACPYLDHNWNLSQRCNWGMHSEVHSCQICIWIKNSLDFIFFPRHIWSLNNIWDKDRCSFNDSTFAPPCIWDALLTLTRKEEVSEDWFGKV